MISTLKSGVGGLRRATRDGINRALAPLLRQQAAIDRDQQVLARELMYQRALLSRAVGDPIRVILLCHMRSLWGKLEPLADELLTDDRFEVTIVTTLYRHGSRGDAELHDDGCVEFLIGRGYDPVPARDAATGRLIDIQDLRPDFVFHSVPYDGQFPDGFTSDRTRLYSRPCYVPYYGIEIMAGDVLTITHPQSFYASLRYAFVSSEEERELADAAHGSVGPFDAVVTGAPMLDAIFSASPSAPTLGKSDVATKAHILWTPRWRVEEGTCHFDDYSDYFLAFVKSHPMVDFTFRPHPLFFDNFVNQGRMTRQQVVELRGVYERMPNAVIDESGSYVDTFLASDILITDISSMMVEYFATGNPIIYTHRVDRFNHFGAMLAAGFYKVENQRELDVAIERLLSGDDPLRERRQEIIGELLQPDVRGAAAAIKDVLLSGFQAPSPSVAHLMGRPD